MDVFEYAQPSEGYATSCGTQEEVEQGVDSSVSSVGCESHHPPAVDEYVIQAALPMGEMLELKFPEYLPRGASVVVETAAGPTLASVVACMPVFYPVQPQPIYYRQHQPYG